MYKFWTKEEQDILTKNFIAGKTMKELEKILQRTEAGISKQVLKLKLKRPPEILHKIYSDRVSGEKNGMYGKESWSKGLTKETNNSLKNASKNLSIKRKKLFLSGKLEKPVGEKNGMYGKKSWCTGLTKETDERLKKSGEKQSKTRKEQWQSYSEDEKNIRRRRWAEAGLKCKKKNTIPEQTVKKYLIENNIKFEEQKQIDRYFVDFYLPKYNLIIECFGDYWHANPIKYKDISKYTKAQEANTQRDKKKIEKFSEMNFKFTILWECDIKNLSYISQLKDILCQNSNS